MTPEAIDTAIRVTAHQAVQSIKTRCYNHTPIVDALTGAHAQVCAKLIEGAIESHLRSLITPVSDKHQWSKPRLPGRPRNADKADSVK